MSEINKINFNGTDYDIGGSGGTGLTNEAKTALLNCFQKVAWIDDNGQDYYDALYAALYPPANLVSISCVYTQSGTVFDTASLDSLKPDLVVTALYDDTSTATVTAYTLSGTLTVGTSTITVSYGGKTTTFTVTVSSGSVSVAPDHYKTSTSGGYPTLTSGDDVMNFSAPSDLVAFTGVSSEGGYWTYWDGTTTGIAGGTFGLEYPTESIASGAYENIALYAVNADKTKCYGWYNKGSNSWSQTTSASTFALQELSGVVLPSGYYPWLQIRRNNLVAANGEFNSNVTFSYWLYQNAKMTLGQTG